MRFLLLASSGLAFAATPVQACEEDIGLSGLRAHLFYSPSGELSEDLLARETPFIGWNTIIGGGDAREPADDLMVVVELAAHGEVYVTDPLEIRVLDEHGDEVGHRRVEGLLTSVDGRAAVALYLQDATCRGTLAISASFRGETRAGQLQLHCGE